MKLLQFNPGLQTNREATLGKTAALLSELEVDVACLQGCNEHDQQVLIERTPHLTFGFAHAGMAILSATPVARPEIVPLSKRRQSDDPNRRALIVTEIAGIRLVAAYLSWNGPQAGDNAIEATAFLNRHPMPTIVAGDFNQKPSSDALAIFRQAGFRDVWAELAANDDGNTFDDGDPRRIDFILERADRPLCRSVRIVADAPRFSDHLGLFAEIAA